MKYGFAILLLFISFLSFCTIAVGSGKKYTSLKAILGNKGKVLDYFIQACTGKARL